MTTRINLSLRDVDVARAMVIESYDPRAAEPKYTIIAVLRSTNAALPDMFLSDAVAYRMREVEALSPDKHPPEADQ